MAYTKPGDIVRLFYQGHSIKYLANMRRNEVLETNKRCTMAEARGYVEQVLYDDMLAERGKKGANP